MSAIATAIALAVATASAEGVEIEAYESDGIIWLSNIERTDGRPGAGAEALRLLMEISDDHDLPIRGAIVHNHERLLSYYEALGFSIVGRRQYAGGYRLIIEFMP